MPRFDYQCRKCKHVFEHEHGIGEHPRVKCPLCRGSAKKLISQVGVVFKGSGFYCTDSRKSGGNGRKAKRETAEKKEKSTKPSSLDDD